MPFNAFTNLLKVLHDWGPVWGAVLVLLLVQCGLASYRFMYEGARGPSVFRGVWTLVFFVAAGIFLSSYFYWRHRYWGLPPSFEKGEIGILIGQSPGDAHHEKQMAYAQAILSLVESTPQLKGVVKVHLLDRPLPDDPQLQQSEAIKVGHWTHATFVLRLLTVNNVQEPWITVVGEPQFSRREAPLGKFPNAELPSLDKLPLPHNVLLLARCVLALSLYHSWHYREASEELRGVLTSRELPDLAPPRPDLYLILGRALAELGRYGRATRALKQALCLRPRYAGAHCTLGYVLDMVGLHREARDEYVKAINIKPDYEQARHDLGVDLGLTGRYRLAEAEFDKAVALKPSDPLPHLGLCTTFDKEGQYVLAIAECQKAIALRPNFAAAYNELGLALYDEKQCKDAVGEFHKVIGLGVKDAQVYDNLGVAFLCRGQTDRAIRQFKKAIALKPDFAHAYNNLGSALTDKGEYHEAIKAYKYAISLEPDDFYPRFGLAHALEMAGKEKEAEQEYRDLLQHHYRRPPE